MASFRFELTLTIRAPVLSQAVGAKRWRLDTAAFKTNDEIPALPGTLVRGNLREIWTYFNKNFNQHIEIEKWFGEESAENTNDEPNRGSLQFDDLWIANKVGNLDKQRYRIQHNSDSGTVKEGALQVIESPFDSGEEIEFIGNIVVNQISQQEANDLKKWLKKGFEFVPAVGAFKGIGFGKIVKVECTCEKILLKPIGCDFTQNTFGVRMILDRPFCFAKHRSGDNDGETNNAFYSEEFISGGAIKGAIAIKLKDFPLEKIHITHAFPIEKSKGQRPMAIPLSWVISPKEKDKLYDVSLKQKAGLINQTAPMFQADWKSQTWEKAKQLCGRVDLSHTLRMHTAIDSESGTSKTGQLFAMDCVEVEQREWLANITFDESISSDQKKLFLDALGNGLDNLGKTKARATIDISDQPFEFFAQKNELKSPYIVVLQSAARLLPHEYLDKKRTLKEVYEQVWQELSDNSLKLINFFAKQQLSGGQYIYQRFQQDEPYNPEILTLTGSVFVLEAVNKKEKEAQEFIEKSQKTGLSIHPEILYGDDWKKTPYTRNNGYGEILVNGFISEVKEPDQRIWSEIEEN